MADVTTKAAGGTDTTTGKGGEVLTHVLDIADFVAAGGATTEQFRAVNIPAKSVARLLAVEVTEALSLGTGARVDIGDSTDDDEFVTNATTLTAGTFLTLLKNDTTQGLFNSTADSIEAKITGGTIATGKLKFYYELAGASRTPADGTITPQQTKLSRGASAPLL